MTQTLVLTNATILLPDQVVHGTLMIEDGRIADIQPGWARHEGAADLEGDLLLPGAVDLHTDNLERQVNPRQNARWPSRAAFLAHDAQCAAAGVTTVLDALCVGDLGFDENRPRTCFEGIADLDALAPSGLLKCDHHLHLRCELPAPGMPERMQPLARHPALRMVSLMDHTPGHGQYGDLARYRQLSGRDGGGAAVVDQRIAQLQAQRERLRGPNRRAVLAMLRDRPDGAAPPVIASHDDRTEADVAENLRDGVAISEFPVSEVAARAAREAGMTVIAGAPNLVRGGSHTGNVGVLGLLLAGLVDALASDYVPASLIHAAFIAAERGGAALGWTLPCAIGLITDAPARMVGLHDRGRIETGLRADLVRVRVLEGLPVVRQVWCRGARVI
jgi:alpha-D-ribose 1-methylphosphonate 5-triphosphate diphosphatase